MCVQHDIHFVDGRHEVIDVLVSQFQPLGRSSLRLDMNAGRLPGSNSGGYSQTSVICSWLAACLGSHSPAPPLLLAPARADSPV